MRTKWYIVASLLLLTAPIVAGCSLSAAPEQRSEPATEPSGSVGAEAESSDGTLIITSKTVPFGLPGALQFTGVPTGTVSVESTLVVANLAPGTYTSTEINPALDFGLVAVECNDGASATPSSGDAQTRTAVFNLDAGEPSPAPSPTPDGACSSSPARPYQMDQAAPSTSPGSPPAPSRANGTLVVANVTPGTYTSAQVDPAPDFEVTAVECDDGASAAPSSGDTQTRTAVRNLDTGQMVTCTFTNAQIGAVVTPTVVGGDSAPGGSMPGSTIPGGVNPFDGRGDDLADFPLPGALPAGAGAFAAPKPGPWSVTRFAGQMTCGEQNLSIPASLPESGVLDVQDDGMTVVGTSLEAGQTAPITMHANPGIIGRYTGSFRGMEQGVPVTITYAWQPVTDEYIVGFLTASLTSEGMTCSVYRSFQLVYTG